MRYYIQEAVRKMNSQGLTEVVRTTILQPGIMKAFSYTFSLSIGLFRTNVFISVLLRERVSRVGIRLWSAGDVEK